METRRIITLQAVVTLLILLGIAGSVAAYAPAAEPVPPVQSPRGIAGGGGPGTVLPMLQYQGRLTNPSTGQPVADGVYAVTFNLYTDSSGSAVWTETKNVSVAGGLFSALIGDVNSLPQTLFNGQELWLGIKVGADAEATPRQTIFPVAYAMSLRPGAVISGSVSGAPILQVTNSTLGTGGYFTSTGSYGVRGETASTSVGQAGIVGAAGWSATTFNRVAGVLGQSVNGYGVAGASTNYYGIVGLSNNSAGVRGEALGTGAGVSGGAWGSGAGMSGANYGTGYGGEFSSASGQAIYASGSVTVTGNLKVNGTIETSRVTYSTPRVQYFTIGSEGFVPGSNVDYFNTYGNGGAYIVSGSGGMVAPVHLPQGAVVTEFRVYYYDLSAGDLDVTLYRQGFNSSYLQMANVSSSGTPGYSSGVDTVISSATIDNTSYSYMVDAYSTAWDSNLKIKAAVIVYTVNEVP